jgi:serine/threonine protein kinase
MSDPSQVEELLLAALARTTPQERAAFLDAACQGNPELRRQVERLLQAHPQAGDFLEKPAVAQAATVDIPPPKPTADEVGSRIGPYKLLQKLGEGGMGTVWVAEQQEPVKRRVALKVIKAGMDSAQVLHRFEAERQALALMDHTHIARVFDGGTTDTGRPFFVMELVKGVPITRYCDELHLSLRDRLTLFVPVCQAIQHAHQKGIIHRDIKPSNVLVCIQDGKPVPKVIDFGVAKALHQRLTEESMYTEIGQVVGTLEYMSPEQAELSTLDIDTRADVYALGVLLYQLLTGTTPFDGKRLRQAALGEMLRILKEEEPPQPSTRLSASRESLPGLAAQRHTEPAKLVRAVRGELDCIVMKCLEKDRTRRYETASGLARDVERYLADEVVEARPPSPGYRLKKLLRRHKVPVAAAAALVLVLLAGVAVSTWQALRAGQAEAEANQQRDQAEAARREEAAARQREAKRAEAEAKERQRAVQAEAVAKANEQKIAAERDRATEADADTKAFGEFLVDQVLAAARPEGLQHGIGIDVKLSAALAAAEQKIAIVFKGRPKAEAQARQALGETWLWLGYYQKAEEHLRRAIGLREGLLGADHPDTLESMHSLGVVLTQGGKLAEAIALFKKVRDARSAQLGPDHPDTLNTLDNLAAAYRVAGKTADAIALFEKVRDLSIATLGPDHPSTLTTLDNLAGAYLTAGKTAWAIALFEKVRDLSIAKLGPDHPFTLITLNNLALAYLTAGKTAWAIALFEKVRDLSIAKLGPDHPHTLATLQNLASAYVHVGKTAEAIALLEKVRDARSVKIGPDHPSTLTTLNNLAETYRVAGKTADAIALYEKVRDLRSATLGPDHPRTLTTLDSLAGAYGAAGKTKEAIALYEKVRDLRRATLGPDHPDTMKTLHNLAVAYWSAGQLTQAVPLFEEVLQKRIKILGVDHPETLLCAINLAVNYRDAKRLTEASKLIDEWLPRTRAKLGATHPDTQFAAHTAASIYEATGQYAKAATERLELLAVLRQQVPADDLRLAAALAHLGSNLLQAGKAADAEPVLRECLDICQKKGAPGLPTSYAQSLLGASLLGQQKYADAEPLLLAGYEGMKQREAQISPQGRVRLIEALERLVQLYDAWGKMDQADQWRKELQAAKARAPLPKQAEKQP